MNRGMRIDPRELPMQLQEQVAMAMIGEKRYMGRFTIKKGNKYSREERMAVYARAWDTYGNTAQMIVALEELAELQKEICKTLRGSENIPHLAEEIADVTIMMEQLRLMLNIEEQVNEFMDRKVERLENRINKTNDDKV